MPALTAQVIRIPQAAFSDAAVRRLQLPTGKKDHIYWDPEMPGFGVRVRPGKSAYVVQYRFQKATQRESLGDVRRLTLGEARKVARQYFAKIELVTDPRGDKRKAEQAAAAEKLTFKVVADLYLKARETKMRLSTYNAAKAYFEGKWAPLHRKPIGAIDRKTVAEQLRRIIDEHGQTSAARARSNLRLHLSRNGMCGVIRILRRAAPDYLTRVAIRKTRYDSRAIAKSVVQLEEQVKQSTLSPELVFRLGPERERLLDALRAVKRVCEEAEQNKPPDDQVRTWCAKIAHTLIVRFSEDRPSSGSALSHHRIVAGLLYEILTGESGRDLKRACDEELRKIRQALRLAPSN